jgi:hypothetical protein
MYPFCLTLPFGGFVALGGLIGFIQSGSTPSLLAGGGSGAILIERTFLFPPGVVRSLRLPQDRHPRAICSSTRSQAHFWFLP